MPRQNDSVSCFDVAEFEIVVVDVFGLIKSAGLGIIWPGIKTVIDLCKYEQLL